MKPKTKLKGKGRGSRGRGPSGPAVPIKPAVWMPGMDGGDPEENGMDYDPTAYDCLTTLSLGWPSLSFDIIPDSLGGPRAAFPHTLTFVAGSQAPSTRMNSLSVCRVTGLGQLKTGKEAPKKEEGDSEDEDSSDSSDSDDDLLEDPRTLPKPHVRRVAHSGAINRVRVQPQNPALVAAWSESGTASVYDLTGPLAEAAAEGEPDAARAERLGRVNALSTHGGGAEGYALDWSRVAAGRLVAGDRRAHIAVWEPQAAGRWAVSAPFRGHEGSVEDLQWSPSEETVFASCSVDHTVRVWDTRVRERSMLSVRAHDAEVNVISWSAATSYMMASGGDDGLLRVWDLRAFGPDAAFVASLKYHSGPVTSVEWCPHESSMLLTTSEDGQTAVWDLALERDPEEEAALAPAENAAVPDELPAQLLFVHAGQRDVKEGHWHPQIPGLIVTTAAEGFNLFKAANV